MSNFTPAQATALFADIQSMAQQLAIFRATETHDPLSAPGEGLWCSITLGNVRPVSSSGMASVSGQITLIVRVWSSALQKPQDNIDPNVLAAACALMGAFAGGFTIGGTVRNIDLFAMTGTPQWAPDFEGKPFRVIEISLPIVINDLFAEVA